jgi:hypothetical protein
MKPILVIACGEGKKRGIHPAHRLYTGSLWQTYSKRRDEQEGVDWSGKHPKLDVFVISARYGLVEETMPIANYNHRLVHSEVEDLADKVREQVQRFHSRLRRNKVVFVGGKFYREVLERAGLEVEDLAPGKGIGDKRAALGNYLRTVGRGSFDLEAELEDLFGR